MLELATSVIERKKGKFEPATLEDRYEKAVLDLIKSRKKGGRKAKAKEVEERPSNVINLFDALKKSLGGNDNSKSAGKEKPEKTSKPARQAATQERGICRRQEEGSCQEEFSLIKDRLETNRTKLPGLLRGHAGGRSRCPNRRSGE